MQLQRIARNGNQCYTKKNLNKLSTKIDFAEYQLSPD